jgi:hypothetical protein
MNTTPLPSLSIDDYRSSMQVAARGFIERHQAEHLHDDGLFERTVRHLVMTLDVPAFMADRIVYLAMSELLPPGVVWVGVDMATGPDQTVRTVLDRRTGQRTQLPCRLLPDRFQAVPATR